MKIQEIKYETETKTEISELIHMGDHKVYIRLLIDTVDGIKKQDLESETKKLFKFIVNNEPNRINISDINRSIEDDTEIFDPRKDVSLHIEWGTTIMETYETKISIIGISSDWYFEIENEKNDIFGVVDAMKTIADNLQVLSMLNYNKKKRTLTSKYIYDVMRKS